MTTYTYDNILGDFTSEFTTPSLSTKRVYSGPIVYTPTSEQQLCSTPHPSYFISEYSAVPVRYNPYNSRFNENTSNRRIRQTSGVRELATLIDRTAARNTSASVAWQEKNATQMQEQEQTTKKTTD